MTNQFQPFKQFLWNSLNEEDLPSAKKKNDGRLVKGDKKLKEYDDEDDQEENGEEEEEEDVEDFPDISKLSKSSKSDDDDHAYVSAVGLFNKKYGKKELGESIEFSDWRSELFTEEDDPCWKGYEQIGTKQKRGKTVPNCVPKKKTIKEEHPFVDVMPDYKNKGKKKNKKSKENPIINN